MKFILGILWIAAFCLATYCWIVVFQHGFAGFAAGFGTEYKDVLAVLTGEAPAAH